MATKSQRLLSFIRIYSSIPRAFKAALTTADSTRCAASKVTVLDALPLLACFRACAIHLLILIAATLCQFRKAGAISLI